MIELSKLKLLRRGSLHLKEYKSLSKIIIIVCYCLIVVTVINFFTGFVNPRIQGVSSVLCILGFSASIKVTIKLESERIAKTNKKDHLN